jgi:hypothetical protein
LAGDDYFGDSVIAVFDIRICFVPRQRNRMSIFGFALALGPCAQQTRSVHHAAYFALRPLVLVIAYSTFGFVSDFGFRYSDLPLATLIYPSL